MSVVIGWTLRETSITAVTRINEFEQKTPQEQDLGPEVNPPEGPGVGRIEFENLTVPYGRGEENVAFKNVSLVIEAGTKFGICGRIGGGKSSLVVSLFRMLDIREGTIFIDSTNINDYPLSALRSSINAIPQDPFFTASTFRENLDPYRASSDIAIEESLRKVQLWDYIQGQGGLGGDMKPESISQGQKQLFSLARAILRRCKIVILDEVTSKYLLWDVSQQSFRGCTIIAIAHRLETIVGFDHVAVMDEGRIIGYDDPCALLQMGIQHFLSCEKLVRQGNETG
ncbi:ABC transporter atnG [Colletotrichum spaethianum]|uniref:ABC transporter atnG n=1 Tax=Colletotrichum spaethianum TaxID=700344 RepID=A0AA37P6M9_9PEZI|nr:ABC transporter atnG [Colletotrichum spaethianum]GKT46851.1 ABC transporter atnG [Colletotrichum spaethianum]